MKQRGRKSTASVLTFPVVEQRSRLNAPASLTKAERSLFAELAVQAAHLKATDALTGVIRAIGHPLPQAGPRSEPGRHVAEAGAGTGDASHQAADDAAVAYRLTGSRTAARCADELLR